MNWKITEKYAESFLSDISKGLVHIVGPSNGVGGSDSNEVDIKIFKENKNIFNIEIKERKSQISQFVVLIDKKNKSYKLGYLKKSAVFKTNKILEHMKSRYEYYRSPNQSGIKLDCEIDLIYECIDNYFQEKNIEFIITSKNENNFFLIHKKNFKKNFKVEGLYRKKRSGTSYLPKKNKDEIIAFLKTKYIDAEFSNDEKGIKITLKTDNQIRSVNEIKFKDIRLYLSRIGESNSYYIKKKSNTNSPTVIFTIHLDSEKYDEDNKLYLEMIK